jgi:hypothetical protein
METRPFLWGLREQPYLKERELGGGDGVPPLWLLPAQTVSSPPQVRDVASQETHSKSSLLLSTLQRQQPAHCAEERCVATAT